MPFPEGTFEGVVSLHTVHHVPAEQQGKAFLEMYRVQAGDSRAVVVYMFRGPIRLAERLIARRSIGAQPIQDRVVESLLKSSGTFTHHHEPSWIRAQLDRLPDYEIVVWRSVSTAFMRALIHRKTFGKEFLRILYRVEDLAPHLMGRWGQYPMIIFGKPSSKAGGS
jgi:ubiquinone/menaquinone biosynthesis C-methylase UbiE